jgi:amino acid permease
VAGHQRWSWLISAVQCASLFGWSTVLLILVGTNLHTLLPWGLTMHSYVMFIGVFLLLPMAIFTKSMREVGWLAILGTTTSFLVGAIIIFTGLIQFADNQSAPLTPPKPEVHYDWFVWSHVSQALNIVVLAFASHTILPNVERQMTTPRSLPSVLNWSYLAGSYLPQLLPLMNDTDLIGLFHRCNLLFQCGHISLHGMGS